VEWVMNRARALTAAQAEALAAQSDEAEEALNRTLWARWLRENTTCSPVGWALTALQEVVTESARRVGPHLFGPDDEVEEVEVLSDPAWLRAYRAAYTAALALGAPGFLAPDENALLARRWTTVFGSPDLPGR
jgi:hypothetical protein